MENVWNLLHLIAGLSVVSDSGYVAFGGLCCWGMLIVAI
jgi:hypothetical protein